MNILKLYLKFCVCVSLYIFMGNGFRVFRNMIYGRESGIYGFCKCFYGVVGEKKELLRIKKLCKVESWKFRGGESVK